MDWSEYKVIQYEGVISEEWLKENPTWHFCCEWDYMLICNTWPEFNCCTCFEKEIA